MGWKGGGETATKGIIFVTLSHPPNRAIILSPFTFQWRTKETRLFISVSISDIYMIASLCVWFLMVLEYVVLCVCVCICLFASLYVQAPCRFPSLASFPGNDQSESDQIGKAPV